MKWLLTILRSVRFLTTDYARGLAQQAALAAEDALPYVQALAEVIGREDIQGFIRLLRAWGLDALIAGLKDDGSLSGEELRAVLKALAGSAVVKLLQNKKGLSQTQAEIARGFAVLEVKAKN